MNLLYLFGARGWARRWGAIWEGIPSFAHLVKWSSLAETSYYAERTKGAYPGVSTDDIRSRLQNTDEALPLLMKESACRALSRSH